MRFEDVNFYIVRHANDFVYGFDLNNRYHGYALNYQTGPYHVRDEALQSNTSYDFLPFKQFLATLSSQQQEQQENYTPPEITINYIMENKDKLLKVGAGIGIFIASIVLLLRYDK